MNPARRTRHHSGARPVPGRCGDIGAGAYGVSCASAGAEPLRAGTARAPKSARTPGISPWHRQKSNHPKIAADDWLLVPEGRRRILAGGKPARAGAAPGCHFLGWSCRGVSPTDRRLGQAEPRALSRHPGPFLRCPAGAPGKLRRFPGAASAAADLPPANLLRCPSGTKGGRIFTGRRNPRCGIRVPIPLGCCSAANCPLYLHPPTESSLLKSYV